MRTVYINLPTAEAVHAFVVQISPFDGQFDLLTDKHVLDAKSLMGVCQLDLTAPMKLRIEKNTKETMQAIEHFIVEKPPEMPVLNAI